jgi:hypothetical protein
MVELILNFGVINHLKPKSESDFLDPGKIFPGFFRVWGFYKYLKSV